jgi:hypothetical protein
MAAIRLCLERLVPRCVERTIEFEMQPISEPKDAVAALSLIMEGMGHGELTASEASSLVSLVEASLKAIEVLDLDQRLAMQVNDTYQLPKVRFAFFRCDLEC